MNFKLAFIGFGVVGQGLVEILLEKKELLEEKYDFQYTVVAISDIMKGSVYDENGIDMKKIQDLVKDGKKLDENAVNPNLSDLLDAGYSGRVIRYWLMSHPYRKPITFSPERLDDARRSLRRLDQSIQRLQQIKADRRIPSSISYCMI